MSFEVEVNLQQDYLQVTVKTDITRSIAADMAHHVNTTLRAEDLCAALIDLRTSRNIEMVSQNFQFANEDAPVLELVQTDRIALLTAPEDTSHDFIEVVMRNAGYDVRIFRAEDDAKSWLIDT